MTGFVGLLCRDGRAVAAADLAAPLAAVSARGAGTQAIHLAGPCGLGIAVRPTTPEESAAPQPAVDPASGVVVVLDGRLDAREELIDFLAGPGSSLTPGLSDAQLVLAAYLRSGAGFAARLVGDFALAVWDPRHQSVLCVRDLVGLRPLYYAVTADRFVFGSNLHSIVASGTVPRRLNRGMLGEYLAFAFRSRQETLFAGVERLPPAHSIQVTRGQVRLSPFWDLVPGRCIRYRDPRDYAQHFAELFRRAVADRLRRIGPVGVALSGGMDSSAVAGVAQQLLDEAGAAARLRAYSITFPGAACDETPFIEAVVDRWGLLARRFPWSGFDDSPWIAQADRFLDIPEYPTVTAMAAPYQGARDDGALVLLTGEGGDFWHQGSDLPHRQILASGDLGCLVDELRYRAGDSGWPNALRLMLGSLLWGVTPGRVRRRIESRRTTSSVPPYLSEHFVREIELARRLHCDDCAERFPDAAQWQSAKSNRRGLFVHAYEMMERSVADLGVELRHPLHDRRLIEFAFAVPDHMKRRADIDRWTLRQAMSAVYPQQVAQRLDKASFDVVYTDALLRPEVMDVLASPAMLDRPWIQPDSYRVFLERTIAQCRSQGFAGPHPSFYLWVLFAVEVWYRRVFGT